MTFPDVELPSNRKFGFFFAAVFAALGVYTLWFGSLTWTFCWAVLSGMFLLTTLVKSDLLRPLNKAWMTLGLVLGLIVSPIVLGIIFFGIFTPVAFVMRLAGRDELRLKQTAAPSYWKVVTPNSETAASFRNQF